MVISNSTKAFGVDDCKISPVIADTDSSISYGESIDVPGIQSIKMSPSYVEKELKGDEKILDLYAKLEYMNWSFSNAKMDLNALATLLGGTVTTSGDTPNAVNTFTLSGADIPGYFKLEGQVKYTDAGDMHLVLYKCKCSSVEYEVKGEEYAIVSASGRGLPTIADDKVWDVVINETAVAIS